MPIGLFTRRQLKVSIVSILLVAALAYYPFRFVLAFELFGYAVRGRNGWLGPTPRGSDCVEDIGKVNGWTCEETAVFEKHRIGCDLWLEFLGYD